MVVPIFGLHTGHGFFCLDGVLQHLQQIDDLHVLVDAVLQGIFHPAVGFTAHINKDVAGGDFNNVVYRGLIAVQVNAVVQQHGHVGIGEFLAENLAYPVVFREDGGDDA